MSNIFVNGSDINRMQSLSSLINNMIYWENVGQYNSAIQNSSLSTLQAVANNNKIDTSYSSYINDLQSTIDSLNNRAASVTTKLSDMTSLKSSYNKTATTLDAFINSIKNSSANSIFDYTNTNGNAINVDLFNNNTTSQRIDYNIIQAATATTATSNILKGVSVNKDSKIVDLFAGNYTDKQITGIRTDINGATTMAQLGVTTGTFEIGGNQISINSSDTVDDVIAKLQMKGYEAGFTADNKFYISSETESLAIRNQNTNFAEAMGLTISKGTFTINGQELYITDSTTVGELLDTINSDEKYGVGASLVDNKIQLIANQTGNVLIEIGKGSSNFTNAVGFTSGGVMRTDNLVIGSGGRVQTLTGTADVTASMTGFAAGSFKITSTHNGSSKIAEITVNAGDTLEDIIQKINDSDLDINASIVNGKLQLAQNQVGSGYDIVVEGGTSDFTSKVGLTDATQSTGILSPGLDADYFTHINGTKNIADANDASVVTAGSFNINGKTINLSGGSINAAIAEINQYSEELNVVAELKDGKVVLRNRLTGTTPLYIEGGTSNFGSVTGLTTDSINSATSTVGSVGSASTMTGTENVDLNTQVSASAIKINGTIVNIAEGTLESAIENINAATEYTNVTASIKNGKLVLTEKRNGALPISVEDMSGNFGAVTGIIGYTVTAGEEEKYGATRTMVVTGREVNNSTQISASTININGTNINVSGTIHDAIQTINAFSAQTGVEAYINTENQFTFRSINYGETTINAQITSGDLGRVIGMGTYTTVDGNGSQVEKIYASVTGGVTGLDEYSQILNGSTLSIVTTDVATGNVSKTAINIDGVTTIGDLITKINSQSSKTSVTAKLTEDGALQLTALSDKIRTVGVEIGGTGDLGRTTGLGNYTITGTTSDGQVTQQTFSKITGTNNVSASTQITDTQFTLSYVNDAGVNVTSQVYSFKTGQTLQDVINTVNNSNWYVRADIIDGKFVFTSRAVGPFDLSIQMLTNPDGTTGDFGRVVGMATMTTLKNDPSQQRKDPAKIVGGTTGLKLTDEIMGSNSITIWMTRENSYTGKDTQTGTGDLLSRAVTINFSDSDGNGHITIQEAINQINAQASTTKVKASLINGQFVLTQLDHLNADDASKYNTEGGAVCNRIWHIHNPLSNKHGSHERPEEEYINRHDECRRKRADTGRSNNDNRNDRRQYLYL